MTIRPACGKDIPALIRLLYQVAEVHHQGRPDLFKSGGKKYTAEQLEEILKDESRPIFVAEQEGGVQGYAFCVFQQHVDNTVMTDVKTLYIDDLCVDENARGRHIGRALYDHVVAFAKASGCYNVTLNVWSCNTRALGFYEKCGLKPQKLGMEIVL